MKRNIFEELKEGFGTLGQARDEKITLRTHEVKKSHRLQLRQQSCLAYASAFIYLVVYLQDTCAPMSVR